ncbi:MAG: hypothetical protein ABI620_06400 [Chloroflexota bacterium]
MTPARLAGSGATERRRGWLAVLAGAALVLAVQVAAPVGVPLYDGVVVQEPYRYLHPTGDHAGSPTSGTDTEVVSGSTSPILVVSTLENPPQAQLIAQAGAFALPDGATSLLASVTPVEPPAPPTGMSIAGNVYRFTVTDQAGNAVALTPCEGCRSLILRGTDPTLDATMKRYADGAWSDLETTPANLVGFQVEPTVLGDFALLVAGGTAPIDGGNGGGAFGLSPIVLIGGGAVILLIVAGLFLFLRVRQAPASEAPPSRGASRDGPPARIPSKRKPPRRPPPPPGRSNP